MNTKTPFGIRLWFLVLALLLVAGGTIYGLLLACDCVGEVKDKLTTSHFERFQMANTVRRELLNLNTSVLRYALSRDPAKWAQFERASSELDRWIDDNDPSVNPKSLVTTPNERQAFAQLNHAYDGYVAAAYAVHSNGQPALVTSQQLAQLVAFDGQADQMRTLVRDLSDAHRYAEEAFLASAGASLANLRVILIAGVTLILALVAAMGFVIYRDTIAPLRVNLVLSQNMLEKQEKLATLGTLAAGIAHEIRNPLTSLKARLYTLEKHLHAVPAAKKDTEIISAEISRLERIVRDVLNFARPSEPRLEAIRAETLIGEVQQLMSPDLEKCGLALVVEIGPSLRIRADSGHLKQALINLIRNAAEATDAGGTITIRTRAERALLGGHQNDAVIVEVADTGKGISPEVEKRLFDPFFTTKEGGTGLGLAIAARIIEKHGGMLRYQTRLGLGTTFGVVLPRETNETDSSAIRAENFAH